MYSAICGEADAIVFHLMEGETETQRGRAVSRGSGEGPSGEGQRAGRGQGPEVRGESLSTALEGTAEAKGLLAP